MWKPAENPLSTAQTCAEISRPLTRNALIGRDASATIKFSIPKHLQSLWEMWHLSEHKASAIIKLSLPFSEGLTEEMPQ